MTDAQKLLQRMASLLLNPGAVVRNADGAWAHGGGCTAATCVGCGALCICYTINDDGDIMAAEMGDGT